MIKVEVKCETGEVLEIPLTPEELYEIEKNKIEEDRINEINSIYSELRELDVVLPRITEDIIQASNIDVLNLPLIVQERIKRKNELRNLLKTFN